MHVERHVEGGGALENRPEPLVVEKEPVGQPVDERPLEAEPGDGALELVGRGLRVGGRDRGKGGKPVGMGAHRLGQSVIGAARKADRHLGVHLLQAGIGVRQHLKIDAGLVHLLQPQRADIVEPLDQPRRALRIHPGKMLFDLGIEVVLFERDDIGLCRHRFPPQTRGRA